MIERLNQLSLAQFIELSCGDNSVLLEENENASEKRNETTCIPVHP